MSISKAKISKIFVTTLIFLFFTFFVNKDFLFGDREKVIFFSVGQGDSAMVQIGNTQAIIDGSPSNELLFKIGEYLPYWDRKIELIILTHPDSDHITGFVELLDRYEVEAVLLNGDRSESAVFLELEKILGDSDAEIFYSTDIEELSFENDLILEVLYPKSEDLRLSDPKNLNNRSIILRLLKNSEPLVLFTGDAEPEAFLSISSERLNAPILKVSHHGSRKNTTEEIVDLVSPSYAVISAKKGNRYGHPNAEILEILESRNIEIIDLRNGEDWVVEI